MRVLFNFKFRNASYLTDKCSVIRRRPFAESIVSPLSTSAPYAYGLLASSAPSATRVILLSAPDQPPKPLGNGQTDAEIIINANVTISQTPLALSIPGINPPWFHWFPSSYSGYPINSDPSASLSACPHLLLWCFWCVRWACRTQAQYWK